MYVQNKNKINNMVSFGDHGFCCLGLSFIYKPLIFKAGEILFLSNRICFPVSILMPEGRKADLAIDCHLGPSGS